MNLLKATIFFLVLSTITVSQTTYIWTGSVNSNFSTAGNWSPVRQVGLVTDILVFETGTSLNVVNVYQVTIGQLIIRNNTNLTLSPAAGNAKCVTVKGSAGEDLVIETGSNLKISGNDPMLNFYMGTGATASISGNLTFQGSIAHNINSADAGAIEFNNGSVFTQNCPGNIFNTSGSSNAVVFKNGSVLKIDHAGALSPFGINAPNTKVVFEDHSSLVILSIGSLQLSGRNLSNLVIEQGVSLNLLESFTSDITIEDITIKQNASLNITNTNSSYTPKFNVHGDLNINGEFSFSQASTSKFDLRLNGSRLQSISGSGQFIIPASLEMFTVDNDIDLHRNIQVNCTYQHSSGNINNNGFYLFTGGKNPSLLNDVSPNAPEIAGKDNSVIENNTPNEFGISQNYPNPFNPSTKINFTVPRASNVKITVFDITGKEVSTLINNQVEAGNHTVIFDSKDLSSGVYFYNIIAGSFTKTMKMILSK
jgi:hypothetical protein